MSAEVRIVARCPGCDTVCEGPREQVEMFSSFHSRNCQAYRAWWRENELQIALGKVDSEAMSGEVGE
jgi:hypothetical protein